MFITSDGRLEQPQVCRPEVPSVVRTAYDVRDEPSAQPVTTRDDRASGGRTCRAVAADARRRWPFGERGHEVFAGVVPHDLSRLAHRQPGVLRGCRECDRLVKQDGSVRCRGRREYECGESKC
jgi:hypothetical protein